MTLLEKSFIKSSNKISEVIDVFKRDKLTFVQACLYFTATLLGLCFVIPLGMTIRNFHGACILSAQIIWDNKVIYPWWQFSCEFLLYSNLGINVVLSLFLGIFTMMAVHPRSPKSIVGSIMSWDLSYMLTGLSPIMMIISCVICLAQLSHAIVVTIGLSRFCMWLMQTLEEKGTPVSSCSAAAGIDWQQFRVRNGYTHGVYGSSFFACLIIVNITAWLLFFVWFTQLACFIYRSCSCCSWEIAEEKRQYDSRAWTVAHRRSRMATPIGTPGGRHTPGTLGTRFAGIPSQPGGPVTMYGQRTPSVGDPYMSKDHSFSQGGYDQHYAQEPSRFQQQQSYPQSQALAYQSQEPIPQSQYYDDPQGQVDRSYIPNDSQNYQQQQMQTSYDTNLGSYEQNEPYNPVYSAKPGYNAYSQQQ